MKKWTRVFGILFVALGVITPLVTALVTFILPETFASSAKILHPAANPTPIVTGMGILATQTDLDWVINELNLSVEWGRKYKQPGGLSAAKCRKMLARMIQIQMPRGSSIVAIKVFSDDKDAAAAIANKLTEVYRRTMPGATIIETAAPNPVPVRPNKKMNIVLGIFAGVTFLVVGLGLLTASRLALKRQ